MVSLRTPAMPSQSKKPPVRIFLRRFGVLYVTAALTIICILISALISTIIMIAFAGGFSIEGLMISILIPALLVPLFQYRAFDVMLQLDVAEEKLHHLTIRDELTGAFNRRYFFQRADEEFARVKRYGGISTVAMMDFDNFKEINDTHGHLAGDQALREISRVCRSKIRQVDVFARYGGDEFIFLFPGTELALARECLDRILVSIKENPISAEQTDFLCSVSLGLAIYRSEYRVLDQVLREADLALYHAKQTGRKKIARQVV